MPHRTVSAPAAALAVAAAALLSALAGGCPHGDDEDAPRDPLEAFALYTGDGYKVEVEGDPFGLIFTPPDGEELTYVAGAGLRLGKVPALDETYNYDPWNFHQDVLPDAVDGPDGLMWVAATAVQAVELDENHADVVLGLDDGGTAPLSIAVADDGAFTLDWGPADDGATAYVAVRLAMGDDEAFYGTGERFGSVVHNGTVQAMQFELLPRAEAVNNEAHVPVPLAVGSRGWGVFAEDPHPMVFDFGTVDEGVLAVEVGHDRLRFHLLGDADPLAVVERYCALTELPRIPPRWAFAPIQWRNEVSGDAMVLQDAADARTAAVPTGAVWLDRPWQSHYMSFVADPDRYPDFDGMVDALHDAGFRLAAWSAPYLDDVDDDYETALADGWFAGGAGPYLFQDFGKLLDLSGDDAMAEWQARTAMARDAGVEGWKLDYGEDIQIGLGEGRLDFQFANGEDERTMHHRYSLYYHRAYAEPYGDDDVFVIARTGTYGGQRWASVIWPGDLDSDYTDFGFDDGSTIYVGGLPAALRAGIGLPVSGFPFFASDTGGFRHGRPTSEVLLRWAQMSALMPVMQYGGGGSNHNPWDFDDHGEATYDAQTLDVFRAYAELHIRLFPYFYGLAERTRETGYPVIRPWGLSFPGDGRHPDDAFLAGPALLVAPLDHGGDSRSVPVPAGRWVDWWTGEVIEGPVDLAYEAPLEVLPLLQAAGSIVPMLREGVQTLSPVDDPSVDSYDGHPGRVWGRAVPGDGEATFALHDGGVLTLAPVGDGGARLTFTAGDELSGLRMQIHAPAAVGATGLDEAASPDELDTCDACWFRDGDSPWIWVAVAAGDADVTVE